MSSKQTENEEDKVKKSKETEMKKENRTERKNKEKNWKTPPGDEYVLPLTGEKLTLSVVIQNRTIRVKFETKLLKEVEVCR